MRYMDAPNVMVPVAACSGLATNDGISQTKTKLPLALSSCDTSFKNQNGLNQSHLVPGFIPPVHFLPENICTFKSPWVQSAREPVTSNVRKKPCYANIDSKPSDSEIYEISQNSFLPHAVQKSDPSLQCPRSCINVLSQTYFPCRLPDVPMNGAEKLTMTGSSNPHSDQLNWLSEVASAAAKGTLNKHPASPDRNDPTVAMPPVLHTAGDVSSHLLLSNPGSVFSPPIVIARPAGANSVRMFTPPFQIERTRHVQQHTSIPGSGTMYYSQASRTAPLSNFYQASSYPVTVSQSNVSNSSVNNPDPSRAYLQVNNYSSLSGAHNLVPSSQLTCSPSYLQHSHSNSSPTNLTIPSSHGRMFQQGRSILISRSPDAMIVHSPLERDSCHVQIQLSPTLPQPQEEATRRKSFTSNDSVLGSSSCSPVIETAHSASHNLEFSVGQQRTSPSHVGYRLPTGKEGSLKHRILRPPSINILDPPHSVVADAPLSAPPIRTHREPSPKQARSIPSSGYRSFSSSASSIAEVSNRVIPSPGGTYPNHCSSFSSECPSPAPPNSPGTAAAQLKYPQSFMKGSIIQLANNKLKQVEDMTTEDFIECGTLSSTLKIDSSTVVSIEKTPFTGAAKLGFHVGQDNIQITVEAPLEHPFFVYKQGWSSCSPERSAQRYGLACHKLKVGDVCISLTDKPQTSPSNGQKVTNLPVPITSVSDSNQNPCTDRTVKTKEGPPDVMHLPSNIDSPSKKQTTTAQSDNQTTRGKRKRRWSAPDNLSLEDDVQSS